MRKQCSRYFSDTRSIQSVDNWLQAYWESERDSEEKEQAKKRDRILKRWAKLVNGLRIYYRLKDQYAIPAQNGSSANKAQVRAP